ncbi:MAG: SDR family NAD(P)-dependent oxidoreductase [Alphaproteobacteria bacterium]|nr:SDR family NAD(P)-dependent oxidoreductase [Alphaproteobacteria bacterium]
MTGRLAWITGASTGIGRALALRLARDGWRVAASARGADALERLEDENAAIRAFPLDVTDAAGAARVVGEIEGELGAIDLVVANAGTHAPTPADAFDAAAVRRLIEINLIGATNTLAAAMPSMIARKGGHIAIVASVAGYRGLPGAAAYSATKAGLIALAEGLKFDLDRAGVKIQVINPGFVRTPLTDRNDFPMPFLMEVDEAAGRIVHGLAGSAFEIAFPRRLAWMLKFAALLPDRLYFPLVAKATGA